MPTGHKGREDEEGDTGQDSSKIFAHAVNHISGGTVLKDFAIPSVAECASNIEAAFILAIERGDTSAVIDAAVAAAFVDPASAPQPIDSVMGLIAHGRALHAAAAALTRTGDNDAAEMLHALAQDILSNALAALGLLYGLASESRRH